MDYLIDAKNKKLGRLASEAALILQGKKQTSYEPRLAGEDRVIVKNILQIIVTGKKAEQKTYYHHTGYMGHLKTLTYRQLQARAPALVLEKAVYNMLPKNRLRKARMKRLMIE